MGKTRKSIMDSLHTLKDEKKMSSYHHLHKLANSLAYLIRRLIFYKMMNKNKFVYTMFLRVKKTITAMMTAIFTVAITLFAMMAVATIIMLKTITQKINPAFS